MSDPSGVALVCDDIREEKGGGVTIVGVMPDSAYIPEYPATIPKLGFYIRVHVQDDFVPCDIDIILNDVDGSEAKIAVFDTETIRGNMEVIKERGGAIAGFIGIAIASPYIVPKQGRATINMRWRDKTARIGSINFMDAPV